MNNDSDSGRLRCFSRERLLGIVMGVLVTLGAALPTACEQQERPAGAAPSAPGQSSRICIDEDEDGFGLGCRNGLDCDDEDASVTTECHCGKPSPGCGCEQQGAVAACGLVYDKVGNQVTCGQGLTTCSDGIWGECILNGAVSLATHQPGLAPGLRTLALGSAQDCNDNPCDPTCTTFVDTPADIPLGADAGVIATPEGVTLPGDTGTPGPPIGGGFGCKGGAYPANTGACSHHICQTGAVLSQSCDAKSSVSSTVNVFSDDFSTGNSKGWTLDPSWEIGPAATSTGHTTGGADPATDTSASSDDNVAGTMLGGNVGGDTVLFLDEFQNLSKWTETGGGNWNVETLPSSYQYPSSGSGSPAAHSDSCSGSAGCTLTLTSAVNLSSYSSASLKLLRFLDSALDNGEYLKLEAYNGSNWATLANWVAGTHDDDTWREETFNLASYRVSGFKLRLSTRQSSSNEHVSVDDVRVLVPPALVTRWMTSPAFNGTAANGTLSLSFRRWLNVEAPASRTARVEVFNGSAWVNVWTNTAAVSESSWSTQTINLTSYKHAAMKVRFGWSGAASSVVSGWNVDDIVISGQHSVPSAPGCVGRVCAKDPTCCSTSWHAGCLALIKAECKIDCSRHTTTNECIACYADPTETTDYDGDGQSRAQGDCLECDAKINSNALDFPGNGVDENCDGAVDNAVTSCDGALTPGGDAWNHAKALGLCKVSTSANDWGIKDAEFVRADGVTACTNPKQYYIMNEFGSGNRPTEGAQMVAYSSGAARDSSDPGYTNPNGNGYQVNTSSTPAHAIPAASGCSAGTPGKDSCGLKITLRAPSNVQSFSYNFNFFTSEYPEWICTAYNDAFVAYYYGSLNTATNKNISFDKKNNPVSVNNGFFEVPAGWPPPSSGVHPKLSGTGFDGVCSNNLVGTKYSPNSICGGATGWLVTSAPVKPSEDVTLHFSIWDTGDNKYDSTVLLDNFRWSAAASSVETGRYEPGTSTWKPLVASSFVRDYDMSGKCEKSQVPVWSLWSWAATTPGNSRIEFYVKTAKTFAELDAAPEHPLIFSEPASKKDQPAVAAAASPDTQVGSAMVYRAFEKNNRPPNLNFVRVRSHLVPTSDAKAAPRLGNWNLQVSCMDAQ